MASWESISENQLAFQRRLMEVYAGFVEHTDRQVGVLLKGLEERGLKDNTLVIYIFGDNGSSAEGQNGSISELLAQNQIPTTIEQQITALDKLGGLDALGSAKTDNMYHAGWAWAGSTAFKSTKLVAAHFGGTRNPMVISWPKRIKPSAIPRAHFLHVNDVVPTIYDILDIQAPQVVNGYVQDPIDGLSFVYTFDDAKAVSQKHTQFFDNNGSRGVYHDGWFASTFGPLKPWISAQKGLAEWASNKDVWQLYDLRNDFSQAHDVAVQYPEKLAEMQQLFLQEVKDKKDFPIGSGIWLRIHPEDISKTGYTRWKFNQNTRRMPEFTAPGLGRQSNTVHIELETDLNASGVLYATGGSSGGLTLYMDQGKLVYEYNMMIIEQYSATSQNALSVGKHKIDVITVIEGNKSGAGGTVSLVVDGQEVGKATLKRSVPMLFTASETFDVGIDLGSPVSLNYESRRPFAFEGKIKSVIVEMN